MHRIRKLNINNSYMKFHELEKHVCEKTSVVTQQQQLYKHQPIYTWKARTVQLQDNNHQTQQSSNTTIIKHNNHQTQQSSNATIIKHNKLQTQQSSNTTIIKHNNHQTKQSSNTTIIKHNNNQTQQSLEVHCDN